MRKSAASIRDRQLSDAIEKLLRNSVPCRQRHYPLNAQFMLDLFLPESRCEEFLGDLQERYDRKRKRLGQTRADWWYRKQVATSLWPLLRTASNECRMDQC